MSRDLMPHQIEALEYCRFTQHPALFMQMRLGKTLVIIRAAQENNAHRCIVFAPLSVLEAWENELTLEGERFINLSKLSLAEKLEITKLLFEGEIEGRVWLLTSYQSILSVAAEVRKGRKGNNRYEAPIWGVLDWDYVILDESTKIKNPSAEVSRLLCEGFRWAKHRCILTGLPSPEGEEDLFQQFKFLDGRFHGCSNYWDFRKSHFIRDSISGYSWYLTPSKKREIREAVSNRAFIKTRSECNIGGKKIFQKRYVDPTPALVNMQKQALKEMAIPSLELETDYIPVVYTWLRYLSGGFDPLGNLICDSKVDELVYLLEEELKDEQVVVWFGMVHELTYVADVLRKKGISIVGISGNVKDQDRKDRIDKFRQGKARVLLSTTEVSGLGLDFSVADTAIYFTNQWKTEVRLQSEDRIIHPSKKHGVGFVELILRDTFDVELCDTIREKSFEARLMMGINPKGKVRL